MPKLAYRADRDFTPIAHAADAASILLVTPSLPAKTVQELISHAKAHPGQLNYATSGNGTIVHLNSLAFAAQAGVQLTHVPYKGTAQSITDLAAGQVHLLFDSIPTGLPHVTSGRLRALAVTGEQRSAALAEVPTLDESGLKGYETTSWFALLAPARTPAAAIDRLQGETAKALATPAVRERLTTMGLTPVGNTPAQFDAFMRAEIAKYAKVIKDAGVKID